MKHRPTAPARVPAAAAPGSVRIIGGRWRGTRLPVPAQPGLRPTSDRVRETLFNWLMPRLAGAQVLDLFAGTGALGLEAVSRGAARAVLVERAPELARGLRQLVERLGAGQQVEIAADDAVAWLRTHPGRFDLVFLDPPFGEDLWGAALAALPARLAAGAWVYLEAPRDRTPAVPADWALHREGQTREVRYALYRTPAGQGADTLPADLDQPDPA